MSNDSKDTKPKQPNTATTTEVKGSRTKTVAPKSKTNIKTEKVSSPVRPDVAKEQTNEERLVAAREQAINNHAREHANDSES